MGASGRVVRLCPACPQGAASQVPGLPAKVTVTCGAALWGHSCLPG